MPFNPRVQFTSILARVQARLALASRQWQSLGSVGQLLAMSSPDPAQQEERIRLIERDLGLVIKGVVLVILLYFLYWSSWVADGPVNPHVAQEKVTWGFAQRVVQSVFLGYLAVNFGVAFILVGTGRVALPLLQWTVFSIALVDGLFLSALVAVTGGIDSALYWLYLILIVRNCLSVGATVPQIILNLLMCLFYAGGVLTETSIASMDAMTLTDEDSLALLGPGASARLGPAFAWRMALLVAVAAWSWGLQLLLTRQRRQEDEQNELALRRQQLEASGRLAAEIAHQLKNPLAIINNASYTLQKTVKEGKTITQQIQIIREEVEKSDRLITELMGYAQLAEGRVERLDVKEELERAVLQVFPPAVRYEIKVHRDYAPGLPLLLAQRNHLGETFVNILQNAREALGGQGEIWVNTARGENYSVVITIMDNGPGIAPEHLERIFTPYFTTREKGTGLGLAIVKHNVEMYGGRIAVESELGKGARFSLVFPARTLMKLRP